MHLLETTLGIPTWDMGIPSDGLICCATIPTPVLMILYGIFLFLLPVQWSMELIPFFLSSYSHFWIFRFMFFCHTWDIFHHCFFKYFFQFRLLEGARMAFVRSNDIVLKVPEALFIFIFSFLLFLLLRSMAFIALSLSSLIFFPCIFFFSETAYLWFRYIHNCSLKHLFDSYLKVLVQCPMSFLGWHLLIAFPLLCWDFSWLLIW